MNDHLHNWPTIIQGGMGVGVSGWRLASAVARTGQLGVVSGSMLDTVIVRRLQDGDPGGYIRRVAAAVFSPRRNRLRRADAGFVYRFDLKRAVRR